MDKFRDQLETLLNKWNREKESGTPDFILARYLESCLIAFDEAVIAREKWYNRLPAGSLQSVEEMEPGQ